MNQYLEFTYETISGQLLDIEGRTDGLDVEFIARINNSTTVVKSTLTTLDIKNIEDEILNNSELELDYYDLDYRGER